MSDVASEQPEMFHVEPAPAPERQPRPKTVARGVCPLHRFDLKLTGVVRSGRHYYWRAHTIPMGLAARPILCSASNAPLCSAPAAVVAGYPTPTCPCGGKP